MQGENIINGIIGKTENEAIFTNIHGGKTLIHTK